MVLRAVVVVCGLKGCGGGELVVCGLKGCGGGGGVWC